jgi:hypothetical protein
MVMHRHFERGSPFSKKKLISMIFKEKGVSLTPRNPLAMP